MRERTYFLGFTAAATALTLVVAATLGGVPTALGVLHDTTSTGGGFSAADDLGVTVENRSVAPAAISTNDSENVTITFPLQSPDAVNESRVRVSLATDGTARSVAPANVTCDDRCTVVVSGEDVRRLAGGPGDYELVVRGWWEYDRHFVVTVPVTVERPTPSAAGNGTTNATTNATETPDATTTGTVNGTTTNGTTAADPSNESTTTTKPTTETTTRTTTTTDTPRTTTETTATSTTSTSTGTTTTTSEPTETTRTTTRATSTTNESTSTTSTLTTERTTTEEPASTTTERTTTGNETTEGSAAGRAPTPARIG